MDDLDALLADLQNSINPGARVGSPGGRTSSPGGRTGSPSGRTSSPGGRVGSPGRLSSSGSLSSPNSTGYGSINGSRNISSDYQKPASPTYQNASSIHEKVIPVKHSGSQSGYGSGTGGYGATPGGYGSNTGGYGATPDGYGSNTSGYGRTTGGRGNLTELDTLLDDLSNARYNYGDINASYGDRSDGYGRTNGATSPASSRPTVDSLLDQLSTDLHHNGRSPSPGPGSTGTIPRPGTKHVTVTVQETVVEPAQAQQQPPVTAPAVRHHHHASSATKELDDLMESLSDFKPPPAGQPPDSRRTAAGQPPLWPLTPLAPVARCTLHVAGERRRGRQPARRRHARVPRAPRLGRELPRAARARQPRAHAGLPPRRHEPPRGPDPPEGLLQRLRQAHRRTGDHGAGPHVAPGALHVRALQPGARHKELLRARRPPLLRARLP